MKRLETRLAGVALLEPDVHRDARGFFLETFGDTEFAGLGLPTHYRQDNHSRSVQGTLRGLHFQSSPGQAKLVRAARGAIYDVVVDLRRSSSTFGEWEGFQLDDVEHHELFVPVGFAHGFYALTDADVTYRVTERYDAATERGVAWNDPRIAIAWPSADPILSDRDASLPRLAELGEALPDW
jgi:dTDP-4-dehydrorhamnose 3,5-epimerase